MDGDGVPTIRYTMGEVAIEDRATARLDGERPALSRTLTFTSPSAGALTLRALAGEIEEREGAFHAKGLALTVDTGLTELRPFPNDPDRQEGSPESSELLIHFDLESGATLVHLTYELLP